MADFTATVNEGLVSYGRRAAITFPYIYIFEQNPPSLVLKRVGYFWYYEFDGTPAGLDFLVCRGAVYFPAMAFRRNNERSLAGDQGRLDVEWDVGGTSVQIIY